MITARACGFTLAFLGAACLGSVTQAEQPVRGQSPFRTAEYSTGDAEVIQVRNGRYRRARRFYNGRYYNYAPYGYRYSYRPYRYRSYPRYYGTPRYGYYNYGRRGGIMIGPFGVWW